MRVLRGEWASPLAAQREAHRGWSHEIKGPARDLSLERKGRVGFAEPHRLRTSLEFFEHGRDHLIHPQRTSLSSHWRVSSGGQLRSPVRRPWQTAQVPTNHGTHSGTGDLGKRKRKLQRGKWDQLCGRSTAPATLPLLAGLQGPMWAEACSARTRSRWGCEEGARLSALLPTCPWSARPPGI